MWAVTREHCETVRAVSSSIVEHVHSRIGNYTVMYERFRRVLSRCHNDDTSRKNAFVRRFDSGANFLRFAC